MLHLVWKHVPLRSSRHAVLGGCLALAIVLPLTLPLSATPAAALPAGLPTHFGFGLAGGQGDAWMPQSGVAWDYRYQYLVGGVNTNAGWETWNTNGTFASNWAQEGAAQGYIPTAIYYEMLQSSGTCGSCGEAQKDISNLNNAGTMAAYYSNFALLMKRLGTGNYDGVQGFGKTALVNIEPDFSGGYVIQAANNTPNGACYGFCTGQGNNPSFLKAAVASSGNAEVTGLPNTYAGFVQALVRVRNKYAPNVLLGLEVSPWATGDDIGLDNSPSTNVTALGQQVGSFMHQTGASLDVLFNNPLDRDAGQYRAAFGQNRWWDRTNVALPNFARWEQYLAGARSAAGGQPILLWQVPMGNQYFDTENNTNGHYQDNRAEYLFGHVPELIQTGIVGVMFGAGNSGSTVQTDLMKDGITNPASFCTTDGVSSGQICNTHTSTVSDDDGGYVRMAGQTYYQNPVSLSGGGTATNTPTATPTFAAGTTTPTATATASATWTTSMLGSPASVSRGANEGFAVTVNSPTAASAVVDLEVYDSSGARVFQQAWDNQAFKAGETRTLSTAWSVPGAAITGAYVARVGIFAPNWVSLYNWNDNAGQFTVTAAAAATLTPTPVPTNTRTATATPTRTPTRVPATSTPTARPTNTPVPTPPSSPSFTTSATGNPNPVTRGTSAALSVSVKSATAGTFAVDLEIYDPSGTRVFQQAWSKSFTAGQTILLGTAWAVPAGATTGAYSIKVGVFSNTWSTMYSWNNTAGTLMVR